MPTETTEITTEQFHRLKELCGKIGITLDYIHEKPETPGTSCLSGLLGLSIFSVDQFYIGRTEYRRIKYQILTDSNENAKKLIEVIRDCGFTFDSKTYYHGWAVKFYVHEAEEVEMNFTEIDFVESQFQMWADEYEREETHRLERIAEEKRILEEMFTVPRRRFRADENYLPKLAMKNRTSFISAY